jgi:hypothetical protein
MTTEEMIKSKAAEIRNMSPEELHIFWTELTAKNIIDNDRMNKICDRMESFLDKQDRSDDTINKIINSLNTPK